MMIGGQYDDNLSDDDEYLDISDEEISGFHDMHYFENQMRAGKHGMEEEKKSGSSMSKDVLRIPPYFERSKKIGRIGPPKTELDRDSAKGDYVILIDGLSSDVKNLNFQEAKELAGDQDILALDVFSKSGFVSIRANTAVYKEAYYYEVTLMTDGLMMSLVLDDVSPR